MSRKKDLASRYLAMGASEAFSLVSEELNKTMAHIQENGANDEYVYQLAEVVRFCGFMLATQHQEIEDLKRRLEEAGY